MYKIKPNQKNKPNQTKKQQNKIKHKVLQEMELGPKDSRSFWVP